MNKYQQLITTLNRLFQTDQEDLDFGIYRIMNQKRDEINSFLESDLKKTVTEGLSQLEETDTEALAQELEKTVHSLKEAGVDPDTAPKVIELKKQINASNTTVDAENEIYSHLVDFFSRYYQEGDFISQRRYKDDVYAIPYQGEEVKLYWANHDQYYIKTTENFSNYSFKLENGNTVTFRLVEASTEQNNNKASSNEERKFKLAEENFIKEIEDELVIYFEYLPVGKKPSQDQLIDEAVGKLLDKVPEDFRELTKTVPTKKNPDRTVLKKKLKEYTSKNTFDYFIHKDLKGFLQRELDFYIKNELLNIDDLDTVVEHNKDIYAKIKVFKSISSKVIDFLAQIENFQKKLWEKKKFVTQSDYLITLDNIDEKHYEEISKNKEQIEQWKDLGFISDKDSITRNYLKDHPFLTLDTQFFPELKDELLANIENLDEKTNGLLINSENWQALNLIKQVYEAEVSFIYIDPPYNTDSTPIIYKNNYRHSSWLSLMRDRVYLSKPLLGSNTAMCVTIDDKEYPRLFQLLEQTFGESEVSPVVIEYNHRGRSKNNFAITHEYGLWVLPEGRATITKQKELSSGVQRNLRRTGTDSRRRDSWSMFYGIEVNKATLEIVNVTDPLPLDEEVPAHINEETVMVWPIDDSGQERRWYYGSERVRNEAKEGTVWAKEINGSIQIHYKQQPKPKSRKSVWTGKHLDASTFGSELINDFFTNRVFDFPKSIYAVKQSIEAATDSKEALILDYFSGSATTAHAVIKLNREDQGNRKYILVEMGKYFDTVTKPRVQKVIYSDNWKNGKPQDTDGVSQIVKYMKLESYEDTLNNVVVNRSKKQQSLLDSNSELKEDYFLHYMLDVETRDSQSLLNIDELSDPFNYSLLLTTENEQRRQSVDVAETFNYLIGLHVGKRYKKENCLIYEGKQHQSNKKIAIIWRNTNEVGDEEIQKLVESFSKECDIIYVNGQTAVSSKDCEVLTLEPEFKKRMFN
ncbi:site-specific DNA-methyltransferase [Candidatus Roizmanbacteria bacterium]|nr:MAG: site-specific DNA-methyltransferase [Candidatus Roizmanbacteria bacterium]